MNLEDERRQAFEKLLVLAEEQQQQIEDLIKIADDNLETAKSWKELCLDMQASFQRDMLLELRTAMRSHVLCFLFVVVFLLYFLSQRLWFSAASQPILLLLTIHDILENRSRVATIKANASKENS